MKTLKDLDLKPKDKEKVAAWLQEWLNHYIEKADGKMGTIERVNFEELDHFFFTSCADLNPESMGQESQEKIIRRKKFVAAQLIFRHLLGEKLGRDRPCSHCGHNYRDINTLGDGTGHYVYCPKCHMTTIVTYPAGYFTCSKRIVDDLNKRGYPQHPEVTKVLKAFKEAEKSKELFKCNTCEGHFRREEFMFATSECNSCYQNHGEPQRVCRVCGKKTRNEEFNFETDQCDACRKKEKHD